MLLIFQADDGIRVAKEFRGLGDVYKNQVLHRISNYKKAYLEATSLREKERIVTKAQLDLKATYGVTSSSDYRANKEFIRSQFED